MKAMIFAAGVGSRLKPFTDKHPKALVPVGGVPMLERVMLKLKNAGVEDIVVNIHHFGEQISDFIAAKHGFGINVVISDEREKLLDTGGGLLNAVTLLNSLGCASSVGDPILLHNADILTDFSISEMEKYFFKTQALAVLMVSPQRKSTRHLWFDHDMHLVGWSNETTGQRIPATLNVAELTPMAFGGAHIVSPEILPLLSLYSREVGSDVFSIVSFYLWLVENKEEFGDIKIVGYTPLEEFKWFDVGSPDKLQKVEKEFAEVAKNP